MLYEHVAEVSERLRIVRSGSGAADDEAALPKVGSGGGAIQTGPSGLSVEVVSPIPADEVRTTLQGIYDSGIRSVAISFMHAYAYGKHEEEAAAIAADIGFEQISQSHQLMRSIKYVSRTTTTTVDAYLTPLIVEYVRNFSAQFEDDLGDRIYFIQSDGGLTRADQFYGFKAVLSGPAGGVVGCARTTCDELGEDVKTVGFDMGGTSTDVCRCDGRKVEHVMEAEIAGVPLQAPQVDVTTVAAGGGSILRWENQMYKVGPESAGAHPGPTCYGNNGPLTVTDANLLLGRLDPRRFPKVFGPNADQPLNPIATRKAFEVLSAEINADLTRDGTTVPLTVEEIASGFLEIANEAMCRPIRNITEAKGYRCAEHVLNVFGGAGGQHGCSIARQLGMSRVYVDARASYLSAVGSNILSHTLAPPKVGGGMVVDAGVSAA
jgi:5-oxoprolinase (ATP-hydrolysing)